MHRMSYSNAGACVAWTMTARRLGGRFGDRAPPWPALQARRSRRRSRAGPWRNAAAETGRSGTGEGGGGGTGVVALVVGLVDHRAAVDDEVLHLSRAPPESNSDRAPMRGDWARKGRARQAEENLQEDSRRRHDGSSISRVGTTGYGG